MNLNEQYPAMLDSAYVYWKDHPNDHSYIKFIIGLIVLNEIDKIGIGMQPL